MSQGINKTADVSVFPLAVVAAGAVTIGTVQAVTTKLATLIGIHIGRTVATALSAAAIIRVEVSTKDAGNGHWFPYVQFLSDILAAKAEAVTGTEAIGATVIEVASTTNIVAQNIIFFKNSTIGNSEFARVKSIVVNTSVTIEEGLTNAQTGATIYTKAQFLLADVDLRAVKRLRLVVDNTLGGQDIVVEAWGVTADSIG